MKKKIIAIALICSFAVGCIGLSGCTTNNVSSSATSGSSESLFVSEYASKYDFYTESVEKLKDDMELTDEEADKVFGALLEVGLDEEITYCFDEKDDSDNPYFKVWWGLNKVDVYLKDNAVDRIMDDNEQLFPTIPTTNNKLNLNTDVIWNDDDHMGIVNLQLDGTHIKEVIINDYYISVSNYLNELDKKELKDYDYIEFVGNVVRDDKIECTIKGKMSIPAIKSYTDSFNYSIIEENIYDLFIPKPLQ